jgi:hypothetical protein
VRAALLELEVVVAGPVFGAELAGGAVVLPPQELMAIISPAKTLNSITFLIIGFSFEVVFRGSNLISENYTGLN